MVIKLRKLSLFFLVIGASFLVYSTPARAATCSITGSMTLDQAYVDANTCDTINVSGTFTLTISGTIDLVGAGSLNITSGTVTLSGALVLGATDDFSVSLGAIVTHAVADSTGVNISAQDITVAGAINTNTKGCTGGASNGYGPNPSTGVCAVSTSGYGVNDKGGAGHGGRGGTGGSGYSAIYGDQETPALLGSGGDSDSASGVYADGGGLIRLNASGILTISGSLSANGETNVNYWSGGGSGGSIYVTTSALAGAGTISANGGNGLGNGGGGGGGRVAVYYNTSTFTVTNITASKGEKAGTGVNGENGTTYIVDQTNNDLYVTSGLGLVEGANHSFRDVTFSNGAVMTDELSTNSASITTTRDLNFTSSTIQLDNMSSFTISAGGDIIFSGVTMTSWNPTSGNKGLTFTISEAETITLSNSTSIKASLVWSAVDIVIDLGSTINTDFLGCPGSTSNGYGPDASTGNCAVTTTGYGVDNYGGGGHGGTGGGGTSGASATYGSATNPVLLGSGGDSDGGSAPHASGGGRVQLNITGTLTLNGGISANGKLNASNWSGGGSGGSVYIVTQSLTGTGTITANGGNGYGGGYGFGGGGGGGGGRVAVYYSGTDYNSENITVAGGSPAANGAAGGIGTSQFIYAVSLSSIAITDNSGYTNDSTPVITAVSGGATPTHIAFSCNGGGNWSDWITYPDDDVVNDGDGPAFNITNGATGCSATNELKTITAKIKDASSESSTVSDSTTFDNVAPTVTNVTSTNANGTYGVGDVITITVQFTENPTVSGTPQIELNMVATDRQADYVSTSTDTLTFTYTIVGGDSATDLDYTGTGALTLNSGTIVDVAGNSATLTLPSPGGAGSFGSNKNIMIVTGGPSSVTGTVAILSPNGGETLIAGTPTVIDWTWTSGTDSARTQLYYSLDGGTTYTLFKDYYNGSSSEYTWTVPTTATSNALIKVTRSESTYAVSDTSNQVFTIVVASTSETTEPSTPTETTDTPTPVLTDAQLQDDGTFLVPTESRSPFTGEIELVTQGLVVGDVIVAPSYDTVYFLDPKGTRRTFMNAQTYFTYYNSFETIKTVSDATLAVFDLGTPMLPSSGVVLVKIQSDSKVYMIDEDGLFRWIANEDVAIDLYGKDWSDYVIDMPVTMWGHVAFGEDVYSSEGLTVDTERLKKRTQLYAK